MKMKLFYGLLIASILVSGLSVTVLGTKPAAAATPTPPPAQGPYGPELEDFPAGINPLTGLPVSNPETLGLPAVLISLSNFPPSVRPQTGLSFAPQVYEIYITEGMTRFLAVFYGNLPHSGTTNNGSSSNNNNNSGNPSSTPQPTSTAPLIPPPDAPGDSISGVRSGREAYVPVIQAFPNSCLVAASKSKAVNVNICKNVYGSDGNNINSAGLTFDQLEDLARANQNPLRPVNYSGNTFSDQAPAGGLPAQEIQVFYSYLNQSKWMYDTASGGYLRYEDYADPNRVGEFRQSTDRLNGNPLVFNNVVILFVEHTARTSTIIDLNMGPGTRGRAIVFRDGQVYKNVIWSTMNEDYEKTSGMTRPIKLKNADGTAFALDLGSTWFHVATPFSEVWELAAPGVWKYRYYAPAGAK